MPRLILLLLLAPAPIFAEGDMAASRGLELLIVGLVVTVHQHLLLGEPNLLDLFPRLLLLSLIQYGGSALLAGALRFLGCGADDLEHFLRLGL